MNSMFTTIGINHTKYMRDVQIQSRMFRTQSAVQG